ncbi:MAG: GGDEF domain-containing protein [Burkholderiales bacterium]|nr:GGDEF domain-containing protein [Burkholderiales bacterium]
MTTQLQELVSLSPDPIIAVNREGKITLFNQAAERLLGYRGSDVLEVVSIASIYASRDLARHVNKLLHTSPDHQVEGMETQLQSKVGRTIDIRLSAKLLMRNGEVVGSIGFFHDLTERKRLETMLKQLSITDNLTGLFNQRHFRAALNVELERSSRYGRPLCLICIDLDDFKQINDQLGHLEGDNALRFAARVLHKALRKTDVAFRYGGDEFMLLLPETDMAEAQAIGARVKALFDALWHTEWSAIADCPTVSLSYGIAERDAADSAESLIQRADSAMYRIKKNRA